MIGVSAIFIFFPTVLTAIIPQPAGQMVGMVIPITRRSRSMDTNESAHLYGWRPPSVISDTLYQDESVTVDGIRKRQNKIPMTEFGSDLWYGPISVGTPAQIFEVVFDTGSRGLLLPGATCETCDGHVLWDPSSSTSAKCLGEPFKHSYADRSTASGGLYTDTVSLAGFTATTQTISVATSYSKDFQFPEFAADGIMGMGLWSIADNDPIPVFQSLLAQGRLTSPLFSFKLSTSGGELYIGGVNSMLYTGSFTFVPIIAPARNENWSWKVNMDNILGDGRMILWNNMVAVIDTGTNYIYGPASQVSELHDSLGGNPASIDGFYTYPCDDFPNVSITFGGKSFPISASTLNLQKSEPESTECVMAIAEHEMVDDVWFVGTVFLQNAYTVFDIHNLRIGFAQLA